MVLQVEEPLKGKSTPLMGDLGPLFLLGGGRWFRQTNGASPALPYHSANAAHTYPTIIQGRVFIPQEGNLEVSADEPPIDAALTGIFLHILQDCAGFTKQLFT